MHATGAAATRSAASLPATMRAGDSALTCNSGSVPRSRSPASADEASDGRSSVSSASSTPTTAAVIARPDAVKVPHEASASALGSMVPCTMRATIHATTPTPASTNGAAVARSNSEASLSRTGLSTNSVRTSNGPRRRAFVTFVTFVTFSMRHLA